MDPRPSDQDLERKRRGRNVAIGLSLAALVVFFYVLSMVKMAGA